jgi:hypothetical protein
MEKDTLFIGATLKQRNKGNGQLLSWVLLQWLENQGK